MTKKRFELNEDTEWWFVKDNTIKVNEFGYRDDVSGEDKYRGLKQDLTEQEVVDLLNELVEDNEQLKEENNEFKKELDSFNPVVFNDVIKGTVILYSKGEVE